MNKKFKVVMAAAVICAGTCVFAREPKHHNHHGHNDGLALAAGIVNLVARVINPQPVVVTPPPPPPQVIEYHYTTPPPQQIIIKQEPIVIRHKVTLPPPPKNNHRGRHRK